jgi:GTP-binding protein SAR1
MFLLNWFHDILGYLGFKNKEAKVCFLGCDNAGKTTLLQMLKDGRLSAQPPTLYATCEELVIGKVKFRTFDLGGHETARRIWRDYYASVHGIVFLVDAADRTRFAEAREELHRLLEEPSLADVPIVILGNKIDIPVAASEEELRQSLGIFHHMTSSGDELNKGTVKARPVQVFMVSVLKRMGYAEAFQWLSKCIK